MPDIFDAVAAEWRHGEHEAADTMRRLMHPHHHEHGASQPAAQPLTAPKADNENTTVQTEGTRMSLSSILTDAKALFDHVDQDLLKAVDSIEGNPEATGILKDVAAIVKIGVPAGTLTGLGGALKAVIGLYQQTADAEQPATPADPQGAAPAPTA